MNVLIIDDDREGLNSLKSALSLNGFTTFGHEYPKKAIRVFDPVIIDAVITDYHFPSMKATEIIVTLNKIKPGLPIIVISADPDPTIKNLCLQAGAQSFFNKPLILKQIINKLKSI